MSTNPKIDYLRIATWDSATYAYLASMINEQVITKPGHWLQYHGRRSDDGGIFHGQGMQGYKNHHIAHMSGERSDDWADYFMKADWTDKIYCTRIDLQVTISEPKEHDGVALYEKVHRKVKSIVRSPGVTTVYVGARSSQLFIRVYEKVLDERFLRCEFELKQDYARNAWDSLVAVKSTKDDLFNSCLKKSSLPKNYRKWFAVNSDRTDALSAQQLEKDLEAQLTYLRNTELALTRLLYQHSTQQAVYGLIGRLEGLRRKLT
jgi:hypothetical protein